MWTLLKNSIGLIVMFVAGIVTGGAGTWYFSRPCKDCPFPPGTCEECNPES